MPIFQDWIMKPESPFEAYSLSRLNNRQILQISMDGPRVNWKLFSMLCEERQKDDADL